MGLRLLQKLWVNDIIFTLRRGIFQHAVVIFQKTIHWIFMRNHESVPSTRRDEVLISVNLGFYSTVKTFSYFVLSASVSACPHSHEELHPSTWIFLSLSTKTYDFYMISYLIIEYMLVFGMYLLIRTRFKAKFENIAFRFLHKSDRDDNVFGLSLLLSYSYS